jgi:hypothetical protein
MADDKINPEELQVHLPESLRAGVYANIVSVSATKREVTLNFMYANVNDNPQGTVVSRVILNGDTVSELAKAIENTISTMKELEG